LLSETKVMFCPSCGAENPEGKRFCGDCGAVMHASAEVESQQSPRKPLTMRLIYMRQWMWGCLWTGAGSLIATPVSILMDEPVLTAAIAIWGVIWLAVGIQLLRKYGTGWNE